MYARHHSSSHEVHKSSVIDRLYRATRGKFWSGGRGLVRAPQVREHALAPTFCAVGLHTTPLFRGRQGRATDMTPY